MFFTTPVPLIAGVVPKLNQGTNRQKGLHFLSGSFFVSFLDKQKRKIKTAWTYKIKKCCVSLVSIIAEAYLLKYWVDSDELIQIFRKAISIAVFFFFLDEKKQKSRSVEKKAYRYRCARAGQDKFFVGCKQKLAQAFVHVPTKYILQANNIAGHW